MTIASRKLRRWKKNPVNRCVLCGMAARHTGISHRCSANNYSEYPFAFEGQASERFANAVRLLNEPGPENLQQRIAGIYDLEKLAKQHPELYHQTVMEVLTSFIRMTVPNPPNDPIPRYKPDYLPKLFDFNTFTKEEVNKLLTQMKSYLVYEQYNKAFVEYPLPAVDIQTALTVIGRRQVDWEQKYLPQFRPDLSQVNASGANLTDAQLQGVTLTWTNLSGADLEDANLSDTTAWQINFQGANLDRAVLRNSHMSGANMQGASLLDADLQNANLRESSFTGTRLSSANLTNADIECSEFWFAVLRTTNLTRANFWECKLNGASLSGAIIDRTDLEGADLSGAYLSHADFANAGLRMTREQFPEVLPEGMVLPRYLQEGYVPTPEEQKWLSCTDNNDCTKG